MRGIKLSRPRPHSSHLPPAPKSHRWWVEEEAPQLGVGPGVLGPKDGSGRGRAGGRSGRALWGARGRLGSTLWLRLPRGRRGPHGTLRLGLRRAELELTGRDGGEGRAPRHLDLCGGVRITASSGAAPARALTPLALSSPGSARALPGPPEWGPAPGGPAVPPSVWGEREQISGWRGVPMSGRVCALRGNLSGAGDLFCSGWAGLGGKPYIPRSPRGGCVLEIRQEH